MSRLSLHRRHLLWCLLKAALTDVPLSDAALGAVLPAALYDTVLAVLVGPLAVAIALRRRETDRVDW